MPNASYIKGRRKEYQLMKILEKEGFDIVLRSAGSHSPIDVVAINKLLKTIKLVQCKPSDFSMFQKKKLEEESSWLNNAFRVEFEVL